MGTRCLGRIRLGRMVCEDDGVASVVCEGDGANSVIFEDDGVASERFSRPAATVMLGHAKEEAPWAHKRIWRASQAPVLFYSLRTDFEDWRPRREHKA
jgi:nitroreductase